ncbi:hypothetical protein FRC15_002954 [Serendipita sp. 397]|nr:hypothetical protein FRC15_002954 [Serendipita sp. 397]
MQRLVQGIKNIPAKLSPKSPSIRRAAQFFIRSPNTSPESERPPISNPIPKPEPVVLRFSYDWEKRRLTGLENWRELCPTSTADPFHDMQIFDTAEVMGDPHKEPELRQPILDKIRQRFVEVIGSTVHELPRSFRLEVMTSEQTPPNTANPVISSPFNVTHTLAVTSDPKTGRLEGLPSAWGGNDAAETTQRTKFTRSLIISDVISYSSLSRYMRPAPPPRPLPAPAVPAIPLVAGAADVPLASPPIISTPVPREPSNQQPKKGVARKPVPALGPGFPETSARLNHRRNPSQGVLPTSPTPPSRPRGVTVSGVPGDTTSSLHTWKPLPPLPPE